MARKKTESRGVSERLEFQLRYQVDRAKFDTREAAERAVKRAKAHFLDTGRSIPGVKIVARWRNPDNHNRRHAEWKTTEDRGHSLVDFWKTLHRKRGALRGI